ncbi:hypothetical protein [Oceanobacillus sp. CAU 1775]
MNHDDLKIQPIILIYKELLTGKRKGLPKGTWQSNQNVIVIIRYALEIKKGLNKIDIPKINRPTIKELKLWGALNRFKSIKKLLQFVYLNEFNEFHFHRVPAGYWGDIENVKLRFEEMLRNNNIPLLEVPKIVTYDLLIKWGFSNPLKRYHDSPFELINAIYPDTFRPFQFRKIPNGYAKNKEILKGHFLIMLEMEKISFSDVPRLVTQELLYKYKFNGALSYYNQSPARFIMDLFPNAFSIKDFNKPQRYWHDVEIARKAILELIKQVDIPYADIPKHLTKKLLMTQGYGGLLAQYDGSPINIIQACFPDEFDILDFKRLPNRYWYSKENRIEALRSYCQSKRKTKQELTKLSRAYFNKNHPRFVSVLDRHYDSKIHLWIIEAFPEHNFSLADFNLLVGDDGQICDSHEELLVHNELIHVFRSGIVTREGNRFTNEKYDEVYLPDWMIQYDNRKIIVEYFGLYGSNRYPGYTEKVVRKIEFYKSLKEYEFVAIFPEDLNQIESLLIEFIGTS